MSLTKVLKFAAGALALVFSLLSLMALPAYAQDISEYFKFTYDPVTFDKSEVAGDEVFNVTVAVRADCITDLPLSPSEAEIISQVVAVHTASGDTVTLNPSYTVNIKPFPSEQGDTAEISQVVPLHFPAEAEPGEYDVFGRIVKAEVKVLLAPLDVTGFLPQEQSMGKVKYTASTGTGPRPPVAPTSSPAPEPEPTPAPADTGTPSPPQELPEESEAPWWVWPVIALAGATTIFNVIWFLRHRRVAPG